MPTEHFSVDVVGYIDHATNNEVKVIREIKPKEGRPMPDNSRYLMIEILPIPDNGTTKAFGLCIFEDKQKKLFKDIVNELNNQRFNCWSTTNGKILAHLTSYVIVGEIHSIEMN